MKCIRILPETCANTSWPFANSARKVAFGRASTTVASTSIDSFFAIRVGLAPHYSTFVVMMGSPSVTITVCSKWTEGLPSAVTTVQLSFNTLVW